MATRKRYSIYPSPDLDRVLADRLIERDTDQDPERDDDTAEPLRGRSATITAMVVRYAEIVRQHTPLFTDDEWALICDSLNGYWANDNPQLAAHGIAHNIADNDSLNAAGHRFHVDGQALARTIHSLSFAEKTAILDVSERFWSGAAKPNESYSDLFKRLAGNLRFDHVRKSPLEAAVKRAAELAYQEDADHLIGRINGDWQIAHHEDLARQNAMTAPRLIVRSDGLNAADVMAAMEQANIDGDQDWHAETTTYRIDDDTLTVSGSMVAINQQA